MRDLILDEYEFYGMEFNTLMASGQGRRLWVTVEPSITGQHKTTFKVENLKKNSHIEIETNSLVEAIRKFNELLRG